MKHLRIWIAAILTCFISISILPPTQASADELDPTAIEAILPFRYARVWGKEVPVYASPGDPAQMQPIEYLRPPDSWVSFKEEIEESGRLWYRIGGQAYVLASDVLPASPSAFQGVETQGEFTYPIGFVTAEHLNVRSWPGASDDNPPIATLSRYDPVFVQGSEPAADGSWWFRIGENQYVHSRFVQVANPVARPPEVPPTDRWVAVDLAQQALTAYEGDRLVYSTLISSGLPKWFTPKGLYRVWVKLETGRMRGGSEEEGDYYYLQDVPWIMYFNRDVGLHGAYWHDAFGTPRSHGCVNLSPLDARWFYEWTTPVRSQPSERVTYPTQTNPGTWVYVYASS